MELGRKLDWRQPAWQRRRGRLWLLGRRDRLGLGRPRGHAPRGRGAEVHEGGHDEPGGNHCRRRWSDPDRCQRHRRREHGGSGRDRRGGQRRKRREQSGRHRAHGKPVVDQQPRSHTTESHRFLAPRPGVAPWRNRSRGVHPHDRRGRDHRPPRELGRHRQHHQDWIGHLVARQQQVV